NFVTMNDNYIIKGAITPPVYLFLLFSLICLSRRSLHITDMTLSLTFPLNLSFQIEIPLHVGTHTQTAQPHPHHHTPHTHTPTHPPSNIPSFKFTHTSICPPSYSHTPTHT